MLALSTESERIVALLHDVVEDGPGWTLERLRAEGFSEDVVDAVDHLTKRETEKDDYMAFVSRAARHPIARKVKLADITDNLDLTRLRTITDRDQARIERYREARAWLLSLDDTGQRSAEPESR
jgi:(p)ppGpp synthase/HD superfamily hydrolase